MTSIECRGGFVGIFVNNN